MRAVSIVSPGRLDFVDIPDPVVGPEDVLIDVRYVGLCGSDLSTYRGQSPLVTYPRIPGHEVSGVIVDRGPGVPRRIARGDRIMISPYSECGTCPACRAGRPNACQFNQTLGVQRDGAMTYRVSVPYTKVFASQILSLEELALVEPLSVGYHAANRGRVSEIDRVLVIGCGTIGIGAVVAAARKGAMVIAIDVHDEKLALAKRFGAAHVIHSLRERPMEQVAEMTDGEGVDVAIEAVGLPETYRLAVNAVGHAGRVLCVGYARAEVTFDTSEFVRKELDILGSRNALRAFPSVIGMMERRQRPFAELINRVYSFEDAGKAFRDWAAAPGKLMKVLVAVEE